MTARSPDRQVPKPVLRVVDAVVMIVGIVVGAGIFRTPSLVAANTGSVEVFLATWLLGGLISIVGALCYAELSSAFPHTGGDYHFLQRAFGRRFAFLFAWARMSVIQTGSIALLSYIVGDYLSQVLPAGPYGPALYAALVVVWLTIVNVLGVRFGTGTQKSLMAIQFAGLLLVVGAGLLLPPSLPAIPPVADGGPATGGAFGMAMVMVLLTFGGWNEAGYVSAELRQGPRKMVHVLVISILIITAIYLLINWALVHALGVERMAGSQAVGIDLMRATLGEPGVVVISVVVVLAALTSVNATIFTGARTNYALGRDFPMLGRLGQWNGKTSSPVNALILQGAIALILIGFGAVARNGFQSMVDFTAPVFWFFFLMVGIGLFILRSKEPHVHRPFRVPLYPLTPLVFCVACAYLLFSSLTYTGRGALVGVIVLAIGAVFFAVARRPRMAPSGNQA